MMNKKTRRLSKMPDEVRAEISPWFIQKQAIIEESPEKIHKLDGNAKYVNSGLQVIKRQVSLQFHGSLNSFKLRTFTLIFIAKEERFGYEPPCKQCEVRWLDA